MAIKNKEKSVLSKPLQMNKISFHFEYAPVSGNYSFAYFGKSFKDQLIAYESLYDRLRELSHYALHEIKQLGKIAGGEQIPLSQFNEGLRKSFIQNPLIAKDSKLTVFRFCKQGYRLICVEDNFISHILHIIAFDFDFSAYSH